MKHSTFAIVGACLLVFGGCGPEAEKGECGVNDPCERGAVCDLDTALCMQVGAPTDATEATAPETFSGKAVPFFRGELCVATEAQAGEPFPVRITPCLHPCVVPTSYQYKHSWSCVGSSCDGFVTMWMETRSSAEGCPEDAFGQFDTELCTNPVTAELSITAEYDDGTPVVGTMALEVPFVSNADAEEIAADDGELETVTAMIQRYPRDPARTVPDGITLASDSPPPPATCSENADACDCFQIGF